jgi:signal transduction histidine kinase/FixJ family two-component response regulator
VHVRQATTSSSEEQGAPPPRSRFTLVTDERQEVPATTTFRARLLIVDDEETLMTALCKTLEAEGYAVTGFTSAQQALDQLRQSQFDLLLTDLNMPEMDGIALLRAAQEIDRDLAGVVMTGFGTVDTAVQALRGGAADYVLKPFRLNNLMPVLARALETRRLRTENIQLREAVSIYELSRAITHGLSEDEVVQRTVTAASQQSDAAAVQLLVPSKEGHELIVGGKWGAHESWPESLHFPIDESINTWLATAREQLSAWDGSSEPAAVFAPPFPGEGVALPIVAGGNFYGILRFSSGAVGRRLTPGQIKALEILAGTAAAAFEAASLLTQLRTLNQELEQRVRDRTQELQAANADLESFSYSVSHDLRAPLRVVDGYCQMFMDEFGAGLEPHGRATLEKARAGATRMNQLIDDLLRLARFSRQPLHTRPVEMSALVNRVAGNLQEQLQGRSVELAVGALPDCVADAALLEQVFTNLLSNALKFTAGRPNARVEVGARTEGAEHVYFVKDNGVGFDMRYAERLFGVFQRLHSQAEFTGTGIGLSIVHRIVRRHGGRTWAEGVLQQGATFYFSLPGSVAE